MELKGIAFGLPTLVLGSADLATLAHACQVARDTFEETQDTAVLGRITELYGTTFSALAIASITIGHLPPDAQEAWAADLAEHGLADLVPDVQVTAINQAEDLLAKGWQGEDEE